MAKDIYDQDRPEEVFWPKEISLGFVTNGKFAPVNRNGETKVRGMKNTKNGTKARGRMA